MPKIARMDDKNNASGILRESGCAKTVFANFKKVALLNCPITEHQPWVGKSSHKSATASEASSNVFAEFQAVVFTTATNSCSHTINDNDATVFVPK